jgi:hypothetical protein
LINSWCNADICNCHTGNLVTAAEPLKREALDTRIEEVPTRVFSVSVDFEIDDALA